MNIEKEKELYKQMDLLQMKEISTYRQQKYGTRIFQLPIKKYGQFIEVGSFESGYVRRMNGCYTPYQLNKCENYDHFYKAYEWRTKGSKHPSGQEQVWTGKYNKHVCRRRLLIDNEVDRIEYLIAYCLKNYYINQANMIENGNYITKWKHEYEMQNGSIDKVRELQEKVMKQERTIRECFEEIDRISDEKVLEKQARHAKEYISGVNDVSVTVNGTRYKVV